MGSKVTTWCDRCGEIVTELVAFQYGRPSHLHEIAICVMCLKRFISEIGNKTQHDESPLDKVEDE